MASAAASAACAIVAFSAAVLLIRKRRRRGWPTSDAAILVAACDLDKTTYPPAGPRQVPQLRSNVRAMAAFERLGGFVFPVTGNNLPQAQVKFTDGQGRSLRDLASCPGIYCNGGLVLGPGGLELERHSLGNLRMTTSFWNPVDFVTALLDFWASADQRELVEGVGMLFFTPSALLGYSGAYDNVEAFCASQRVVPQKVTREELLTERERVLMVLLLFPPLTSDDEYETRHRPWQLRVHQAIQARGLCECMAVEGSSPPGVGQGLKITPMKDPWPEIDICVGGVDKGTALARFLKRPEVTEYLGHAGQIEPAAHVAVFGDAANDVPMFRAIAGASPSLRVAMPHATHGDLLELANVHAEVSDVLDRLCEARAVVRAWPELRALGMSQLEIISLRIRAFVRAGL